MKKKPAGVILACNHLVCVYINIYILHCTFFSKALWTLQNCLINHWKKAQASLLIEEWILSEKIVYSRHEIAFNILKLDFAIILKNYFQEAGHFNFFQVKSQYYMLKGFMVISFKCCGTVNPVLENWERQKHNR